MACLYDLARIKISRRCNGYYLRWYYNGWHYWLFATGKIIFATEGEKYRTLGTQKLVVGSTQLTLEQTTAIRTITNTREIYIYTDAGWGVVRLEASSWQVLNNLTNGYDIEITLVIGSRAVSTTGFSPAIKLPSIPPSYSFCAVSIGTQVWMCLNYDTNYPASKVYNNDETYRSQYGGLYTYNQIMSAGFLPAGWTVPTRADWQTLVDFIGTIADAGGLLKEVGTTHWFPPNTGAVDTYGFAMRSTGYYDPTSGLFLLLGQQAMLLTADEYDATRCYYVMIEYNTDNIYLTGVANKNQFLGLRLLLGSPSMDGLVSGLVASAFSDIRIDLTWSTTTYDETGFRIERSTDGINFVQIDTVGAGVLTYQSVGLNPNTRYYYRVRAYKGLATTVYSNIADDLTVTNLMVNSTGTGAGVATLMFKSTANIAMTIDGTGMFYDDPAGTINPGTSRTILSGASNTFYFKVTAGAATIKLNTHKTLVWWGNALMSEYGFLSAVNAPSLDIDVADIPKSVASFALSDLNNLNITGTFTDLPPNLTELFVFGNGVVFSGNVLTLPRSLTYFYYYGTPAPWISGNLSDLPPAITAFVCPSFNSITGNVSTLPATVTDLVLDLWETISGNLSSFPAGIVNINIAGSNTLTGNISNLPASLYYFRVIGNNTISDYSGKLWTSNWSYFYLAPVGGSGLSSAEVDQLLIDLSAVVWAAPKVLWVAGNNGARTAASDAAVLSLTAQGVIVTTN